MSHKFLLGSGFLIVVALATPHLGALVPPGAVVGSAPAVVVAVAPAPVFVPVIPQVAPASAVIVAAPEAVYGDAKTADFDPEHPPLRMGEPG